MPANLKPIFQEMFQAYQDYYVLIGGTATSIILDANKELCLVDMYDVLETVIIFCLLFGVPEGTPKVQMRVQNFDAKFFENSQKEVSDLFKKYSFNLMVQ